MMKRKSRVFRRGGGKDDKSKAKAKGKSRPLRFGSGTGFKPVVTRRGDEAPDAYLGAVDGAGGFSPAMLRQALIIFYTQNAPDKESLDDVFDILLNYTSKRGIAALNTKLKNKYGADLQDIVLPDDYYEDSSDEGEPPPPDGWHGDEAPPAYDEHSEYRDSMSEAPPPPPMSEYSNEGDPNSDEAPPPPFPGDQEEDFADKRDRRKSRMRNMFTRRKSRAPGK